MKGTIYFTKPKHNLKISVNTITAVEGQLKVWTSARAIFPKCPYFDNIATIMFSLQQCDILLVNKYLHITEESVVSFYDSCIIICVHKCTLVIKTNYLPMTF